MSVKDFPVKSRYSIFGNHRLKMLVYGIKDNPRLKVLICMEFTKIIGLRCLVCKTGTSFKNLDPVVQSIVSLTSSLRGQLVKCFMTLSSNTLIFFAEKMREAFALQKLLTFFQQKFWRILDINV